MQKFAPLWRFVPQLGQKIGPTKPSPPPPLLLMLPPLLLLLLLPKPGGFAVLLFPLPRWLNLGLRALLLFVWVLLPGGLLLR